MTHIILLDGKLWAFDPPEKPSKPGPMSHQEFFTEYYEDELPAYNRAYSLALEQMIEVDPESVVRPSSLPTKENEPIKWEGGVEYGWQIKVSTAIDSKYTSCTEEEAKSKPGFHSRRVVRLIAPVKEENSAMSYTEGSEADDPLSISGHIYRPPVPSEQENNKAKDLAKIYGKSYKVKMPNGKIYIPNPSDVIECLSEQENQEEWIPCFKRLPDTSRVVLCHGLGDRYFTAVFNPKRNVFVAYDAITESGEDCEFVDCWQEIKGPSPEFIDTIHKHRK